MLKKDDYLTIGEMAKATGVGTKSLKYYEKIGVLKPVFIDPSSNYRYYSFSQTYFVDLIQICIQLDIPLKELKQYIDKDENIDYLSLFSYGKKIAQQKLSAIQRSMDFINHYERELQLSEKYGTNHQFYSLEIPELRFYVVPYEPPIVEREIDKAFNKLFIDLNMNEWDVLSILEWGLLNEYLPSGVNHYIYAEIPEGVHFPSNTKVIPAGTYLCQQSEVTKIDQAPEIFAEFFKEKEHCLVFETEVYSNKQPYSNLKKELRVIAL